MSVVLRGLKTALPRVLMLVLMGGLAACVSTPAPPPVPTSQPGQDEASASLMRVGYRFKRAGEADQIILPPERFLVTAIDGVPVNVPTTSTMALPLTAGKHSITIVASGGLMRAESIVDTTITKNRTYQPTGWLNNHGTTAFVVWIEDSETSQPASAKISISASRPQ